MTNVGHTWVGSLAATVVCHGITECENICAYFRHTKKRVLRSFIILFLNCRKTPHISSGLISNHKAPSSLELESANLLIPSGLNLLPLWNKWKPIAVSTIVDVTNLSFSTTSKLPGSSSRLDSHWCSLCKRQAQSRTLSFCHKAVKAKSLDRSWTPSFMRRDSHMSPPLKDQ